MASPYDTWCASKTPSTIFVTKIVSETPGYIMFKYAFMPVIGTNCGYFMIEAIGSQDLIVHGAVNIDPNTKQIYLYQAQSLLYDNAMYEKCILGSHKMLKRKLPREMIHYWVPLFFGKEWHLHLQTNLKKVTKRKIVQLIKALPSYLPDDISERIATAHLGWETTESQCAQDTRCIYDMLTKEGTESAWNRAITIQVDQLEM